MKTHFGFRQVDEHQKVNAVAGVFNSVASQYDVMNDVMSLGLHRLWKRHTIAQMGIRAGMKVLDLAGGTGDFTRKMVSQAASSGQVWLADINGAMLKVGKEKLLNEGKVTPIVQCDGENLPFADGFFDRIIVAFGLRNMTHKDRALAELYRVLAPGGQLFILEFSEIVDTLKKPYDLYSFKLLPWLGKMIANDSESYRYLVESIRMHPNQATLCQMMKVAGFERVSYENLSAGIVALHRGIRQ